MRIRQHIRRPKIIESDTDWRDDDLPPRFSGIYERTRPMRAGWRWRSVLAKADGIEYIFLLQVKPRQDNWLAWLILKEENSCSIVSRYEYHSSHPGFHAHADCTRGGVEKGPDSIDNLLRIPKVSSPNGPTITLKERTFWEKSRKHFRIEFKQGQLL